MSETYDLFQQGRSHLRKGRAAQATVALEKAKKREPDKASIREALGIAYFRIQRYDEAERVREPVGIDPEPLLHRFAQLSGSRAPREPDPLVSKIVLELGSDGSGDPPGIVREIAHATAAPLQKPERRQQGGARAEEERQEAQAAE